MTIDAESRPPPALIDGVVDDGVRWRLVGSSAEVVKLRAAAPAVQLPPAVPP
jgi:hypothetical protein